jgi:hypothetical protein
VADGQRRTDSYQAVAQRPESCSLCRGRVRNNSQTLIEDHDAGRLAKGAIGSDSPTRKGVTRMHRPDRSAASPPGAAPTSRWRRRILYAGCLAPDRQRRPDRAHGSAQGPRVECQLNVELREGCLADPSVVAPRALCPMRRSCATPTGAPRSSGEPPTGPPARGAGHRRRPGGRAAARPGLSARGDAAGRRWDRGCGQGMGPSSATAFWALGPIWRRRDQLTCWLNCRHQTVSRHLMRGDDHAGA